MHGLDDVARTMLRDDEIADFECDARPRAVRVCPPHWTAARIVPGSCERRSARVAQRGGDARDRAQQRQLGRRVAGAVAAEQRHLHGFIGST